MFGWSVCANTRSLREPILPHYVSLRSRYVPIRVKWFGYFARLRSVAVEKVQLL